MDIKEILKQKINSLNDIKDCMTIFVKADKDDSCREQMKEIMEMVKQTAKLQQRFHELKPQIIYESGERHQRLISEWQSVANKAFEIHALVEEKKQRQKEVVKSPIIKGQCKEVTPKKHLLCVPNSNTMKTPLSALNQRFGTPRMLLSTYKESPLIRKIRPVSICFEDFSFKITQAMFSSIPK